MKHYLFNQSNKYKYLLFSGDATVITTGILISYSIRIYLNQGYWKAGMFMGRLDLWHVLIVGLHLFTLYVMDLYNLDRLINLVRSSIMVVISVFLAGLMTSGFLFFVPRYVFGRQVFLIHLIVLSLLLVSWRLLIFRFLTFASKKQKIALICQSDTAKMFLNELSNSNFASVEVSHICSNDVDYQGDRNDIVFCSSLSELLKHNQFDVLVFDSTRRDFSDEEIRLILETRFKSKGVFDLASLYMNLTGKIPLEYIDGKWMMNSQGLQGIVSKPYIHLKRIFDIIVANLLLIVFSPFAIITAILIKLESKGQVIFCQERLGQNRKPFMCYKFRTMKEHAELETGPVWSDDGDSRVTRLGAILRKTRLDELPQLWNIIKGDISFVGPRPIRKHFADILTEESPFYEIRFSVQPGLSGWAQVHSCYAVPSGFEALKYELFYIQNMSLFLDIIVIFKTLKSFLKIKRTD